MTNEARSENSIPSPSEITGSPVVTRLPIRLPPYKPASPEEIARRTKLMKEILELRARMKPLGFDAADLVRADRDGDGEELADG